MSKISDTRIRYMEKTDSTMLEARRITGKGVPTGTVIWAGEQTAGRGRIAGRRWESAPGEGLLFTVIFTKEDLAHRMNGRTPVILPLLCGLSAAEAVESFIGGNCADKIRIKWPNDVLVGGRKLCGILCEMSGDYLYAGVGINLNQTDFPPDLRRPACSVRQLSGSGSLSLDDGRRIINLFTAKLDVYLTDLNWRLRLNERLYRIGEQIRIMPGLPNEISQAAEPVAGLLLGVDESGAIVLKTDKGSVSFLSGELIV